MTEDNSTKRLGKGMFIAGWIIILALLASYFAGLEQKQLNPNQDPESMRNAQTNQVILKRNRHHHYVADGKINGKKVTFLVDTGATSVALSRQLARKLGLREGASGYANTANGLTETRATVINELKLGSITLYDVPASITYGMQMGDEVLLGMSALKNVEFTHRDGQLTMTQHRQ